MKEALPEFRWIRKGGVLVLLAIAVVAWLAFRRPSPGDSLNVPLGVEQAAIVTYSGPPIAVAPYKWGVAVNVRIAATTERPGARVYDVRYLVNRAGTFDLKEYLVGADGKPLAGLPSFKFSGGPKLSRDLDARIRETEEVRVRIGGFPYLAVLASLAVIWLAWLLLLIFFRRPPRRLAALPPPPPPSLAAQLQAALAELQSGQLDAEAKARLEMLILHRWRELLALPGDAPMSAAHEAMRRHETTANSLRHLQLWLHHRASPITGAELAAGLAPFAAETPATPP